MVVDSSAFRQALGRFSTGVTVVTLALPEGGDKIGVTISAFSSLSLDPPLILFCLDKRNRNLAAFQVSSNFAVNILGQDQADLSNRFAKSDPLQWQGVDFALSAKNVPLLSGCLAVLECSRHAIYEGGDHVIIIGKVEHIALSESTQPLLYYRGAYGGFEPL